MKAASACTGGCSTPPASRSSPGSDRWAISITGRSAGIALLLGLLLSLPILARSRATIGEALLLAFAANVVGAWFATVFAFWQTHYFVPGAAFALALGIVLLVPLVVIALARMEEIATVAFGRRPRRLLHPAARGGRRLCAEGIDPYSGLSRAAGDAQGHPRCGREARLPEFRMRGGHQQHARSCVLASGRGALPDARRALQVRQRRQCGRLQGRRAASGARPQRAPMQRSSA